MPLIKHWVNAQFRDIYDFELKKFPAQGFTTTIVINGLYVWGYGTGPRMSRQKEPTTADIYVTDRFIADSETTPLHLTDWTIPRSRFGFTSGRFMPRRATS